jgi:hypothetical protein
LGDQGDLIHREIREIWIHREIREIRERIDRLPDL